MVEDQEVGPVDSCQNCSSHRSTDLSPTSPNPGYMKLPNHKLRRVRQTVYEDPGNPFASARTEQASTEDRDDLWRRWPLSDPQPSEFSGHHLRNVMASEESKESTSDRAEACPLRSIALPRSSAPMQIQSEGEYVAPRTLWQGASARRASLQRKEQKQDKRDTKFYGFYDEIMSDYRQGSRASRFF